MSRFHVTLIHLGDYQGLPQDIVTAATEAAVRVAMPPFEVAFDSALSLPARPRNQPLVLCGHEGVGSLIIFQQGLEAVLGAAGLKGRAQAQYTPHVTLLYDDRRVDERTVERVDWTVREYVLVHSTLGRGIYVPLARWQLST